MTDAVAPPETVANDVPAPAATDAPVPAPVLTAPAAFPAPPGGVNGWVPPGWCNATSGLRITMTHDDSMRSLRLFGEEVLPAVREIAKELDLPGPFEVDPKTNQRIEEASA